MVSDVFGTKARLNVSTVCTSRAREMCELEGLAVRDENSFFDRICNLDCIVLDF